MLDFSNDAKVNAVSFSYVIPYNSETSLSEKEVEELLGIVEECCDEEYPFNHNLPDFYDKIVSIITMGEGGEEKEEDYEIHGSMCLAGWFVTNVTGDDFVRPCCFSDEYMGTIKEESFKKIWNSPKYGDSEGSLKGANFGATAMIIDVLWNG